MDSTGAGQVRPSTRPYSGAIERTIFTVRNHARLIAICAVLTCAVAMIGSSLQTKQYTSVASLLFRENTIANSIFGSDTVVPTGEDASRQAATNVELVGLTVVSRRTAKALDDGTTPDEVKSSISVEPQGQSDLVLVKATDPNPAKAQLIANTFAEQFIDFRATADRSQLLKAKKLAEVEFSNLAPEAKDGPRGDQLSRGAERIGILASLQTGNAELVQPGELADSPSSPKPLRNGFIGLLLGLALGVGLAFLAERLNRRLRNPEEMGIAFSLPVLGEIPESEAIHRENDGHGDAPLPFQEEEAFRLVRASLRYFSVDHNIQTILVTSASADAGKSTLAWNMARVAAKGASVVVVEADLRNPSLAKLSPNLGGVGLAEVLTSQAELDEAIQTVRLSTGSSEEHAEEVPNRPNLDVIIAGATPPNPAELLESQAMAEVVSTLRGRYDFIVVDTPPMSVVSDAFPLVRIVDGVVVVARMNVTSRDSASDILETLDRLGAPVLGVVANAVVSSKNAKYGYGYGSTPSGSAQ